MSAEGPPVAAALPPRLDDLGVHLTPVAKAHEVQAEWVGETRPDSVEPTWLAGDLIKISDGTSERTVAVGDVVFFSGERKGKAAEIGRLTGIWQDADGCFWVNVAWFWRPEHILLCVVTQKPERTNRGSGCHTSPPPD